MCPKGWGFCSKFNKTVFRPQIVSNSYAGFAFRVVPREVMKISKHRKNILWNICRLWSVLFLFFAVCALHGHDLFELVMCGECVCAVFRFHMIFAKSLPFWHCLGVSTFHGTLSPAAGAPGTNPLPTFQRTQSCQQALTLIKAQRCMRQQVATLLICECGACVRACGGFS